MFLIEFSTQSIVRPKSLIKANITSAKKRWGALQAKLYVPKRLTSSARSKVRVSDLLKIRLFLFYNVTVSTLNYISCLLKIYTTFISPDSQA
jgi:hypothetical protein